MSNTRRHAACLAFGLCLITLAVNLQAPLYPAASGSQLGLACVVWPAVSGLPDEAPRQAKPKRVLAFTRLAESRPALM